jgi:hypothetical protein
MKVASMLPQRAAVLASVLALALTTSACQLCDLSQTCTEDSCGQNAHVCMNPTVRALAEDVDSLEKHIERHGSVVAQQPSVWGQARLTRNREEFEQQLGGELAKFQATLQASLSRSDQAYAADATALSFTAQAAASGAPVGGGTSSSSSSSAMTGGAGTSGNAGGLGSDLTSAFGAFDKITRTDTRLAAPMGFGQAGKLGIALEPTVYIDQMKRYIDHLHAIRRINEGDDTADSPGYSLNLVRIPVSVLPGRRTDVGFGAEITFTLTPHLHDELLPMTFRNLVVNDLLDQIGVPLTQMLNSDLGQAYFEERLNNHGYQIRCKTLAAIHAAGVPEQVWPLLEATLTQWMGFHADSPAEFLNVVGPSLKGNGLECFEDLVLVHALIPGSEEPDVCLATKNDGTAPVPMAPAKVNPPDPAVQPNVPKGPKDQPASGKSAADSARFVQDRLNRRGTSKLMQHIATQTSDPVVRAQLYQTAVSKPPRPSVAPLVAATKLRHAMRPFPPSQMLDIYGVEEAVEVALALYRLTEQDVPNRDYVHYPDVQGFLQEELQAADRFLNDPTNSDLWQFCNPELVSAIRARRLDEVRLRRREFECTAQCRTRVQPLSSVTVPLAWAIVVDSALLNDQLVQDMKEAASARGWSQLPTHWLPYFLPSPSPEARAAFNDYVRCRWPIHVFALDPTTDQQNIADTYSARREMQLAMSLGFVGGRISARKMMRYARRIEFEMETIALNNTSVGFSHGSDTFGWRFYPRFQTPDIESNLKVFFRDLLIGGPNRNALLRQRRLEPGIRECVAIVLMPSFVPYADLEAGGDWFRLDNPHCKVGMTREAVNLGQRVKAIQNCGFNVGDAECYRDGDLFRLMNRARQLETRLCLQSMSVAVPYENTLGGFAMFNTGVTDLAPELLGWYGAPAISLDAPTTIFLIGNHFSVHQTRVIVGGQEVTAREMLSRQVMKVTIPAGALPIVEATGTAYGCNQGLSPATSVTAPVKDGPPTAVHLGEPASVAFLDNPPQAADAAPAAPRKEEPQAVRLFVDVHLATPYGVTSHLLIPACKLARESDAGGAANVLSGLSWAKDHLDLCFIYKGVGIGPSELPFYRPQELPLDLRGLGNLNGATITLKMKLGKETPGTLDPVTVVLSADKYDPVKGILKLTTNAAKNGDLDNLVNAVFKRVQDQFGPETTNPPRPVTVAQTELVIAPLNGPALNVRLRNQLTVNWIRGNK